MDRPIAGESLTTEPGNAAYERPPQVNDMETALAMHLEKLHNEEAMEGILHFLELGENVQTLVEGITRSAVMAGIHSIDISLQVAPFIHEAIVQVADELGVEYDEGFGDDDTEAKTYSMARQKAMKSVKSKAPAGPAEDPAEEAPQEEEQPEEQQEPSKGLMQRRA